VIGCRICNEDDDDTQYCNNCNDEEEPEQCSKFRVLNKAEVVLEWVL